MEHNDNPLKIKNFKDASGILKDIKDIEKNDKTAYIFAVLMGKVIQNLEVCVPIDKDNDRIFRRAKYNCLADFNEAYAKMLEVQEGQ